MLDFRPPKDSPLLISFAQFALPAILKISLHDTRVQVVGDGLERFKQIGKTRTVVCPNHSNRNDPEIMFTFAKKAGQSFNFLAAREVFDWHHGWNGWVLQHVGCYSVVRGAPDRESFKTTRRLIVEGKKKLVIFPEGEISRQNDTLMALESGVAQMSFWALDELKKHSSLEPVVIMPIAVKYTYRIDIKHELEKSLWKLEDRLGVRSDPRAPLYGRLRMVAEKLLGVLEREYDCNAPSGATMNERLQFLKEFMLKSMAAVLQVELPAKQNHLEWIRILRNSLDDFVYADEVPESQYEKKLHEQKAAKFKGFYRDLDRVVNFIAIYDGYLSEHLSQERFADVIDRFESEVFGQSSIKGPRLVLIDVGRAINLLDFYPDYQSNKRETLHKVNSDLSQQISTMLEALDKKRQTIFVD